MALLSGKGSGGGGSGEDMIQQQTFMHRRSASPRGGSTQYKRYPLSNSKKFSNLFFPERNSLLELVDHFLNKVR